MLSICATQKMHVVYTIDNILLGSFGVLMNLTMLRIMHFVNLPLKTSSLPLLFSNEIRGIRPICFLEDKGTAN